MKGRLIGLLAAVLMVASGTSFVVPQTTAAVSGGIIPCSGLGPINGQRYAGGVVTVFKGQVTWIRNDAGNLQDVLPAGVVAQQHVAADQRYRFVLNPGRYVLQAGPAYTSITLQPSDDVYADIPNVCI